MFDWLPHFVFMLYCSKVIKKRVLKRNPLKNLAVMQRLNPYAVTQKRVAKAVEARRKKIKQQKLDARRGVCISKLVFVLHGMIC